MTDQNKLLEIRTELFLQKLEKRKNNRKVRQIFLEKLERSDKKEIEKMIKRAISTETKKLEKERAKEIKGAITTKAYKKEVEKIVASEINKLSFDSGLTHSEVVEITKKVLIKLYRALAYNYSPVIDRITL